MIRPLANWLVVRLEEPRKQSSVIVMNETSNVRTAEVLRVGPGKLGPIGVEVGERVAFLRWNLEHKPGKQLAAALAELGEDIAMIKAEDVLFVFEGELEVGT